jgi:hypothetical protein
MYMGVGLACWLVIGLVLVVSLVGGTWLLADAKFMAE